MEINKQKLVAHIYRNGTLAYSYEYDDLGQPTRENNTDTNRTYVYTYDTTGNILSKKVYDYTTAATVSTTLRESHTYYYGKTDWNDLLLGYDNASFSYDEIGNPKSYYNGNPYTFTWKQGRRLATAVKGSNSLSFTYNDEGIRTSKTIAILSNATIHLICTTDLRDFSISEVFIYKKTVTL